MSDAAPEFETIDALGHSALYAGAAGVVSVPVPAVAGKPISEAFIRCVSTNTPITKVLSFSIDNVTFNTLGVGEALGWSWKKLLGTSNEVTQIYVKGNVANVLYEVIVNTEE